MPSIKKLRRRALRAHERMLRLGGEWDHVTARWHRIDDKYRASIAADREHGEAYRKAVAEAQG